MTHLTSSVPSNYGSKSLRQSRMPVDTESRFLRPCTPSAARTPRARLGSEVFESGSITDSVCRLDDGVGNGGNGRCEI